MTKNSTPTEDEILACARDVLRGENADVVSDVLERLARAIKKVAITDPRGFVHTLRIRALKDQTRSKRRAEKRTASVDVDKLRDLSAASSVVSLDRRAAVYRTALKEAKGWPGRWSHLIFGTLAKCERCDGKGIIAALPTKPAEAIRTLRATWTQTETGWWYPPTCSACEDSPIPGRALAMSDASPRDRARARALRETSVDGAARAKRKGDSIKWLEYSFAAWNARGESARERLILDVCTAHMLEIERSPNGHELALVAILAGDWPDVEAGVMSDAAIIRAMKKTVVAAHARALKNGSVRPLAK